MNFLDKFFENAQVPKLIKILPVGTHMFHADGRTGRHDKANSRFSKICESAYKVCHGSLVPG
jgi:hypothetical protein